MMLPFLNCGHYVFFVSATHTRFTSPDLSDSVPSAAGTVPVPDDYEPKGVKAQEDGKSVSCSWVASADTTIVHYSNTVVYSFMLC